MNEEYHATLTMTVLEAYRGLGLDFYKLNIKTQTEGGKYRGPREWLAYYDQEQKDYLKSLLEPLYPGGTQQPIAREKINELTGSAYRADGYICPFCFHQNQQSVRTFANIGNLRKHIMDMTWAEEKAHPINSGFRIHDPAILQVWQELQGQPTGRASGWCAGCGIPLDAKHATHITNWFYCNRRNEAFRVLPQSELPAHPGTGENPPRTMGPVRPIRMRLDKLGLYRDPQMAEREQITALVTLNLIPIHRNLDPASEMERIINLFEPARHLSPTAVPLPDLETALKRCEKVAHFYKGAGKAFRMLTSTYERFVEGKQTGTLTEEQYKKTLQAFPEHPAVQIEIPEVTRAMADFIVYTPDQMSDIIMRMPEGRAQGPSGLSSTHLRVLAKNLPNFSRHLAILGNTLLNDEKAIERVPSLYKYRIQCIPKPTAPGAEQKFRPICIQEPILTALHKFLARRMLAAGHMKEYQYCYQTMGLVKARCAVYDFINEDRQLLVLDIHNAFGTVPHAQIIKMLHTRPPGIRVAKYIERYLKARHSDDLPGTHEGVGVPQGDPLSMYLFSIAIEPVLEKIREELGGIVAYADDLIIGLTPGITAEYAIARAKEIYGEIGLTINEDKCQTTDGKPAGTEVNFLGQPFAMDHAPHMAGKLKKDAERMCKILNHYPTLRNTAEYIMLTRSVLPAVNYGPLCDVGEPKQACPVYHEIDGILTKAVSNALCLEPYQLTDEMLQQFMIASPADGGLALMFPGAYYNTMQMHTRNRLLKIHARHLAKEFFASFEYSEYHFSHPMALPVQVVIPYIDMLENDELKTLLDMRFGAAGYKPEVCPVCNKPPGHHEPKCAGYMKQIWGVHNDILRLLLSFMHGRRHAVVRQEKLPHDDRYYWSDGSFIGEDNATYQIDVSVVWNGSMKKRYDEKMQHASDPDHFLPFIVHQDGHVHGESLDRIKELAPELTTERIIRAVAIPLARRMTQRARTVSRKTLVDLSQLCRESFTSEDVGESNRLPSNYPAIFGTAAALDYEKQRAAEREKDRDRCLKALAQQATRKSDSATVELPAAIAEQEAGQAEHQSIAHASQSMQQGEAEEAEAPAQQQEQRNDQAAAQEAPAQP